jgi:hypothetical protein
MKTAFRCSLLECDMFIIYQTIDLQGNKLSRVVMHLNSYALTQGLDRANIKEDQPEHKKFDFLVH